MLNAHHISWMSSYQSRCSRGPLISRDVVKKSSSPSCNGYVVVVLLSVRHARKNVVAKPYRLKLRWKNPLNLRCSNPPQEREYFLSRFPTSNESWCGLASAWLGLGRQQIHFVFSSLNTGPRKAWHSSGSCGSHQKCSAPRCGTIYLLERFRCSQYVRLKQSKETANQSRVAKQCPKV